MYYKLRGKIYLGYYTGMMLAIWLHICLRCLWRVVISSHTDYKAYHISVQQYLIKSANMHHCFGLYSSIQIR